MKQVLLSFDIEEFDMPLEYGKSISLDEQIRCSSKGTEIILNILLEAKLKATFFSTVVFATHCQHLIQRIKNEGHELASHSYYHSRFQNSHFLESKVELENIYSKTVTGFRMPRMMPVDDSELKKAGYVYNSSMNPTYLPGRYNNLNKPRTLFYENGIAQLPASTTPIVRFPLFWLSFHNLPLSLYKLACKRTINHDQYLNLYFHPWEFVDITKSMYGLPGYISKNSGEKMITRFRSLIEWMKNKDYCFSTISDFLSHTK